MLNLKTGYFGKRILPTVLTVLLVLGTVVFFNLSVSAHAAWENIDDDYGMSYLAGSDAELVEAREKTVQLERTVDLQQNKVIFTAIFNHGHESWNSPYEYAVIPAGLTNFSMVRYEKNSGGDWTQTDAFPNLDSFSGSGKYKYAYPSNDFNKYFKQYTKDMWNADGSFDEIDGWKEEGMFSHMLMWQTGWNSNAYKWVITMDIPENYNFRKAAVITGMCTWNGRYARGAVIGPHYARDKYDVTVGSVTKFYGERLDYSDVLSQVSTEAPDSELVGIMVATELLPGFAMPKIGKNKVAVRIAYTDDTFLIVYVDTAFIPVVLKSRAQVKFTLDSPSSVEDRFSLRIVSSIPAAEWNHYFYNTAVPGATADYIYKAGIVAYRGSPDDFDLQTAESVIGGAVAENYACAETDYFQKPNANSDALFGAIVKLKHSTAQNDIIYLCWVNYIDDEGLEQLAIYRNAEIAPVVSSYDALVSRYIAAYPY